MMTNAVSALCCASRLRVRKAVPGSSTSKVLKALQENFLLTNPQATIMNSKAWFGAAHDLFGVNIPVQQCANHAGRESIISLFRPVSHGDTLVVLAAIAWKKRLFRKYFDKQENYIWFHMCLQRLFPAPTIEIAAMLQRSLVVELLHRG